jgi:sulfoxide reductase heme-binding subunit YedZ
MSSQVWWWLARASGMVAWCIVTAAIVWGLTLSSRVVRRRKIPAWLLDLHRYLGTLSLIFVAVHVGAIAADSYVAFGWRELFVPMASTWRPGAVAWGIAGFYILVIVEVTSWLMRRLPRRLWHTIHLSSFVLLAVATVHGALAGADRGETAVQFGALAGITTVAMLVVLRILNQREEAAPATPAERLERLAARRRAGASTG